MALAQRRHWYAKLRSPMPMATYREADVCRSAFLCVNMYPHMHVCVFLCVSVCVCVCSFVNMCVRMCVCY